MMEVILRSTAALVLLLAPTLAAAPSPATAQSSADSVTVIRNVRVFDGERVIDTATVIVRDGRIAEVERTLDIPAGAVVVEGAGRTLLPGLIDAHTHTRSREDLVAALAHGVTMHLDMFGDPALARTLRAEPDSLAASRAALAIAGIVATAPGGHGTQSGLSVPTVASPADADAFVAARVADGSEWIKIIVEDGDIIEREIPTFDQATIAALVRAAHTRDLLAVAHVSSAALAERAIAAGVDGLMHLWLDAADDAELAERLRARDMFIAPTLAVYRGRGATAIPALARMDVRVLAGSDAPNAGLSFGSALHTELAMLTAAGLTPVQALTAATSAAADAFRLPDRGRIRPGARADLLLVDGDPTMSIAVTLVIQGVWKDGVRFDHASWLEADRARLAALDSARVTHAPGPLSDFEDGTTASTIGTRWQVSSDQRRGGASTAALRIVDGGHGGSAHALEVTGRIVPGRLPLAWAGALLPLTGSPPAVASVADAAGFAFAGLGDGRLYEVTFYTPNGPATAQFTAGAEWREYRFAWSDFDDLDPAAVIAVSIDAAPPEGAFRILIDDVQLLGAANLPSAR